MEAGYKQITKAIKSKVIRSLEIPKNLKDSATVKDKNNKVNK